MSVQPGPTFKRYAANGVATVYTIPFLLLDAADLQVTLDGVLITSGFTLAGIGNPASSCTFSVAPTGDLLFQQMAPFQRLADYQINGEFLAETVNRDLDRLWLAIKQVSRDSGRALTVNALEPEGIPAIPLKAARGLKMLGFNADGNPVVSSLTIDQIEQQPALALAAANAAQASANSAAGFESSAAASAAAASASAAFAGDPWYFQPIGVPIPLFTNLTGVAEPPTNQPYRYIKLTASDAYNTGVLASEVVTGSAPSVIATAVISLSGSPINGRTVSLINTERRFLRAGSSGAVEQDAFQGHRFNYTAPVTGVFGGGSGSNSSTLSSQTTSDPISDGTNGAPRTASETRPKNIGVTYYMRIK